MVNSVIVPKFLPVFLFFITLSSSRLWSEGNLASLLDRLEYDQEIKGLFVPKDYFNNRGSIFIGSAKIIPAPAKLYSIGWSPAFQLDSVRYGGSTKDFFNLAINLAKSSRSDLYFSRLRTEDCPGEVDCFISKNGKVEPRS